MKTLSYRPDIDGLRALSVLGVIFFHAGLGFPGGYIGVDVFFVISGFLITGIILRELENGSFLLRNFWIRRIKRIIPAAAFLVLATLACACILLDPETLRDLGKAAIAQALMVSNFYFWQNVGYFAESSELELLLHTWSLAVEEQFYLFFPLLMLFLWKRARNHLVWVLVVLFGLSLMISIVGVYVFPRATFFLLPTRAWELLAGAFLAYGYQRYRLSARTSEFISGLGLSLVLIPMMTYHANIAFPGLAAVPPVLGAVLVIWGCSHHKTIVSRLLSLKVVVLIGLMSYSLYLWHWPIIVFARHVMIETSLGEMGVLLALTFALSWFSWQFVEKPFRSKTFLTSAKKAYAFGAATIAVTIGFGSFIYESDGFPGRVKGELVPLYEDIFWNGREYMKKREGVRFAVLGSDEILEHPTKADYVLWGDSHGAVAAYALDEVSKTLGMSGVAFVSAGDIPVAGLWRPIVGDPRYEDAVQMQRARLDWIKNSGIKHLILVARWNSYVGGMTSAEEKSYPDEDRKGALVSDLPESAVSTEVSAAALARKMETMLGELREAGVTVWLIRQSPEANSVNVARNYYISRQFPLLNEQPVAESTSLDEYLKRRATTDEVFSSLDYPNLHVVDPLKQFFSDGDYLVVYGDGRSFYRDDDHLTRYGVTHYYNPVFEKVLSEIQSAE